jgi:hypothetical protein
MKVAEKSNVAWVFIALVSEFKAVGLKIKGDD